MQGNSRASGHDHGIAVPRAACKSAMASWMTAADPRPAESRRICGVASPRPAGTSQLAWASRGPAVPGPGRSSRSATRRLSPVNVLAAQLPDKAGTQPSWAFADRWFLPQLSEQAGAVLPGQTLVVAPVPVVETVIPFDQPAYLHQLVSREVPACGEYQARQPFGGYDHLGTEIPVEPLDPGPGMGEYDYRLQAGRAATARQEPLQLPGGL